MHSAFRTEDGKVSLHTDCPGSVSHGEQSTGHERVDLYEILTGIYLAKSASLVWLVALEEETRNKLLEKETIESS